MAERSLKFTLNSNPDTIRRQKFPAHGLRSSDTISFGRSGRVLSDRSLSLSCSSTGKEFKNNRFKKLRATAVGNGSTSRSFDVVIIGAGIIGLTIARQFLLESNLSVAIVDAAVPCAGATGAGQGYIWRVHKTPGTEKWDLAMRSHQLWESLAESLRDQGMNPEEILGWKKTGSLLLGRTAEDSAILKKRVDLLNNAGLGIKFLSTNELLSEEPAVEVGDGGGAAFMPDDCQLDAYRAVAFIEEANRQFAAEGRYAEYYHEPAVSLLRSGSSGEIEGVQTTKNTLYCTNSVVVAAGCWSGSLMHELMKETDIEFDLPIKPRKGHLLVIENFKPFKLKHGLMEMGYVNHQSATLKPTSSDSGAFYDASTSSVMMAATMDVSGNLVLGSSRQLVGFSTEVDESIIEHIWQRAGEFLPALRNVSVKDLRQNREVRVGLRPYMPDGKPVIGPVPGMRNLFVAAGHEGEGLSLAFGTAEMVADMVLGNPVKVDPMPFRVQGRCTKQD